ncbi:unnamed protein product [Schistosoma margrebowiei]|uniref:Uncharacterized protein n=1 Tax=Schistosoma margrebowiei TaxID=48269 RepID=A0A183MBQ6_9TREM|nr:unnamed protein product [Schistosoma margrebowiei]
MISRKTNDWLHSILNNSMYLVKWLQIHHLNSSLNLMILNYKIVDLVQIGKLLSKHLILNTIILR